LDLEGCNATNFDGLTDEFGSLSTLSMANNKLNSLKAFPILKTLTTLNLKDNHIEGGLDHLSSCDQLKSLDLSNNKFSSLEQLDALKSCTALETLFLSGCPIASTEDYKNAVFAALPQLKTIDGTNRQPATHSEGENGTHKNGGHTTVNGDGDAIHDEAGVEQLLRDDLEDDDEEYNPEGEEEDDDDEIDEDEDDDGEEEDGIDEEGDAAEPRGVKRKHENEDPAAQADDNSTNGTH